jgi:hypothetical protein
VLDIAVTQESLQCPRIMPLIGQGEAAGVSQHVRVSLEAQLDFGSSGVTVHAPASERPPSL